MTKREQIEAALRAIDAATFQRLGDAYLHRRGYPDPHPIGLSFGAAKTATRTPDTLGVWLDGRFGFVEYSTQQGGLAEKFAADLAKCFDEVKTGIPVVRIAEVVLCYTGRLTAEKVDTLGDTCRAHGADFTAVGLGALAHDLHDRYPGLAREFLGVEVDTGQVLRPDDFVAAYGRSAVATPRDTTFRFRRQTADEIVSALDAADVVFVAGRPGVGKTRLALESARRYAAAHPGAEVWCVLHRGADLFNDLRARFQAPGHYLLVLDDANRLTRFEYALELLRDARPDRTIKLLATVRDYAAGPVQDAARAFGAGMPIVVEPLSRDEIRTLVQEEFGILNHVYSERIADVARGNPRLSTTTGLVRSVGSGFGAWEATMHPIRLTPLSEEQLQTLDALYRTTHDVRVRTRAQIVLLAAERGPRGQRVMIPTPGQPTKHYGLGAVNYHPGETVVLTRRRKRRKEVAELLEAVLAKHPTGTGYVAWDNADTHANDEVEAVVRGAAGRLVLLYLPTYSPWLNPIEMLWRHFRREVTRCELFVSVQALLDATRDFFDRATRTPEKTLSVFGRRS